MKTNAAVLWKIGDKWSVEEVDVAPPGPGELTLQVHAAGLCHSDDHNVTGDMAAPMPVVGGHEGTGEVVEVGPGVDRYKPGDRVLTFPMPACGRCRFCSQGRSWLCDLSARTMSATSRGDRYPFSKNGQGIGAFTQLGVFSEYTTVSEAQVFPLPDDIAYEPAALVGCGVSTGYGAAVRAGGVRPGDTVVVIGAGGVGMAAVQGAVVAGASSVLAVDPVMFKRAEAVRFGATHTSAGLAEAAETLRELTWGRMADVAIVTVGVMHGEWLDEMAGLISKGGKIVMTSVTPVAETTSSFSLTPFAMSGKSLIGNLAGFTNPLADFEELWRLHRAGRFELAGMVTNTYRLDQINEGYADMHAGNNVRGVVVFG
ncbi:S-(hydroxymethyl)glutathione dehydrogenase/alcohol dehydrogenase [Amycolatopsis bartoniae]|uniref:Putative zinc-type alcohol dehydrogenase AdhD n=1 Tax=Amycolatopsis bartoniae TaxID=941986 RepID=A0A8H9M7X5_9PSEU|nr:NDMA-dependent alcohol dehydrogenase [Amycolatopsis bartoniae]MBB2939688.1 S-(hydroxymethyl)glutathione dehydrogenase/alcohol dehydrogenase [Amycolatopsis bartoniae]TVT06191.1 NDMA-dependent alcohol dehydrogenase [Amycolatopsis bartoniae]GHF36489.1 putative zinc-type alcohol dehydrogenase AdhD [Amycolatopsis bartoniae]